MRGEPVVEERELGVQHVERAAVGAEELPEEEGRLVLHGLQERCIHTGEERLAGLERGNGAELQPLSGEVLHQGLRLRVGQHAPDLPIRLVKSGPLGGDQQIGGMIADGLIHALIFFPDPLAPQAHDVDVKALLRIALVYDIPAAFSPATADLLVAGGLLARG